MSRPNTLDAIVVRTVDFGDSDRIVHVLSAELGRLGVVVRRARQSKRGLGGLLEAGAHVRLTVRHGRGELASYQAADPIQMPVKARETLEGIARLAYGCELCSGLAPEGDEATTLHRLLTAWLALLESEAGGGRSARVALEAKALTFAGLTPALIRCARCGDLLAGRVRFDAEAGGGLHDHCGTGRAVALEDLHRMEHLRRTPLAEASALPAPSEAWLLSDFAQYQLGRALRSRPLLEAGEDLG